MVSSTRGARLSAGGAASAVLSLPRATPADTGR